MGMRCFLYRRPQGQPENKPLEENLGHEIPQTPSSASKIAEKSKHVLRKKGFLVSGQALHCATQPNIYIFFHTRC